METGLSIDFEEYGSAILLSIPRQRTTIRTQIAWLLTDNDNDQSTFLHSYDYNPLSPSLHRSNDPSIATNAPSSIRLSFSKDHGYGFSKNPSPCDNLDNWSLDSIMLSVV